MLNKCQLFGTFTRDPELKYLKDGTAVVSFALANNQRWGKGDQQKEMVTFVDCEAWGPKAEVIGEHFVKGSNIMIDGALKMDSWEKDGTKHNRLKIRVDGFWFVPGGKKNSIPADSGASEESGQSGEPVAAGVGAGGDEVDESIPF